MEQELARLAGPVAALLPIHGTTRVLACTDLACVEIDVASGDQTLFVALGSPVAGGGGWDDLTFVVETKAMRHERRGGRGAPVVSHQEPFERIHGVVTARAARRIARVPAAKVGHYRSDALEVLDDEWRTVTRFAPDARDCFEIDRVALSPDGEWVGMTGFDIAYTSDGDWSIGQYERAFVAACATGRAGWSLALGHTWRPSEHVERAIALGDAWWFFDRSALPALRHASDPPLETDLSGDDPPGELQPWGEVQELAVLSDDGYVALRAGAGPSHLMCGHPAEPLDFARELALEGHATAFTVVESAVLVGYADGRIVRIDYWPTSP